MSDAPIKTAFVKANGLTFEVDQCGEGEKFALLLHGFPESKFSWRYQMPLLARHGYRVWAPNMRGYGIRTKFWGYFYCAKYGVPRLRPRGSILFTIGGAARTAIPGTSGVAAVNGAILSMATTLARELAPIRVNILSPGLVDTPAYNWMTPEQKAVFFKQTGNSLPVGRIGTAEEIAQAAYFLVTNGYTTGAVLDVDGGGCLS